MIVMIKLMVMVTFININVHADVFFWDQIYLVHHLWTEIPDSVLLRIHKNLQV